MYEDEHLEAAYEDANGGAGPDWNWDERDDCADEPEADGFADAHDDVDAPSPEFDFAYAI